MSNINNLNAVSFLSVQERKNAQALINAAKSSTSNSSSSQKKNQEDRAETASIASYSSSSALLKDSNNNDKYGTSAKADATSKNLDVEKLQGQGFMSHIRFSN
jgi:hypothetical protein